MTSWLDHISDPDWCRLGAELPELSVIAENCEMFRALLGLLTPRPAPEEKASMAINECRANVCC